MSTPRTDNQLRQEGYINVTGYRDTFTAFDIWTKDADTCAVVVVRDALTGLCTFVEVSTKPNIFNREKR